MEDDMKRNLETDTTDTLPEGEGAPHDIPGAASTRSTSGSSLRSAIEKSMESLSKALGAALEDRANVVMVRVNDEALQHLDMLVEAEVTKSRSESAAFLINEGIKANHALFEKIGEITRQIAELREQLRQTMAVTE